MSCPSSRCSHTDTPAPSGWVALNPSLGTTTWSYDQRGLDDAFGSLFVLRDSDDGDVHILGGHRCEEVGLESCLLDEHADVLAGRAHPGGVGGEPDIEDQRWMQRRVWAGPRVVQASTACSATLAGVRFGTVLSANEVPVGVSARVDHGQLLDHHTGSGADLTRT